MKKTSRRIVSAGLAVMMAFTLIPVYSAVGHHPGGDRPQPVSAGVAYAAQKPADMAEATEKFTGALSKFIEDTSKMSEIGEMLTRFGGVASMASGVISILQFAGVIRDPAMVALGQILDGMKNMQDQLKLMDQKLDGIANDLITIQANQEIKDRAANARTLLVSWRTFNTQYQEPLDDQIDEYEAMINQGIKDWWGQKNHGSLRVLYTRKPLAGKGPDLTFSKAAYGKDFPKSSDNGEPVDSNLSFGLPAAYLPVTTALGEFDVNTYRDVFETSMAEGFMKAAAARKLDAGKAFYDAWAALPDDAARKEKARQYAVDILNTQIYHVSCDVMSSNDGWVTKVTSNYKKYCNNVKMADSGVDAMLNSMILTHGFQGEIRDRLEEFCDAMIAEAGLYGQFAMSCADQDNMQTTAKRQELQGYYADTINYLSEKKEKTILKDKKGNYIDNYCYPVGAAVDFYQSGVTATSRAQYTMWTNWTGDYGGFRNYSCTDWKRTDSEPMVNSPLAAVIYYYYQRWNMGNQDKKTFAAYLNAYGTGTPADYQGLLMTNFVGSQTFPLSDGIRMSNYGGLGHYFGGLGGSPEVNIYTEDFSGVENQYFVAHDKAVYDAIDTTNGKALTNQMAAARALYVESEPLWTLDEVHFFNTAVDKREWNYNESGKLKDREDVYTKYLNILRATEVRNRNSEGDNDPLSAFNNASLSEDAEEIYDSNAGNNKRQLTDLRLKSSKYTYTGKAIKPAITVKAGKKTVPASGYTVTRSDNRKIGEGIIVVRGKGKYAGTICKSFTIAPKGTAIQKIKRGKTAAKVRWKKQRTQMSGSRIDGYEIRYSTSASMKKAKVITVKGYKKGSRKLTGLKKNKKYYVQIRTYMKVDEELKPGDSRDKREITFYSKWSKKKKIAGYR